MASPICPPTTLSSSPTNTKSTIYSLCSPAILHPRLPTFRFSALVPQLGLGPFTSWNGLRHLGISVTQKSIKIERKAKCKGKVVYASLFGVGAPEALVIGVVALLVFGPKGLAEVARNLGKTLRAFQPTIKELRDVSNEFKNTLEREIGLDEISTSVQDTYRPSTTNTTTSTPSGAGIKDSMDTIDPNGVSSPNKAYSSEEYLKITEEQLKASAALQQAQTQSPPPEESQLEAKTEPLGAVQEGATAIPPSEKPKSET